MIRNPRARRRRLGGAAPHPSGVRVEAPETREALANALRGFAAEGRDLLVVDGGDGTVREVLGLAAEAFRGREAPRLAVLSSGTTNVLATDLGVRPGWSVAAAMAATRTAMRTPMEVRRIDGDAPLRRGFIFGAGAYVEAVRLAERARHVRGAGGAAVVGAALAQMGARTAAAGRGGAWRAGVTMRLQHAGAAEREEARFLLLASTLARLPLGLKPFGPPREGLKVLDVEGAPRRLRWALPLLLAGADRPWLIGAGYRRSDPDRVEVTLRTPYVLDGDEFEGGSLVLTRGEPVTFVVP